MQGAAIAVVPPGDSHIVARSDTQLVHLITCHSNDVLARCRNDEAYREHHPKVAPFAAWPEPGDGHRVRVYPVRDFPYAEGRFGRIFRCSTFMVNFFDPELSPRNPDKLSPHSHDDFEQCSLVVDGAYVHHLRTPWSTRLSEWREDVHELCGSPSLVVIPPPAVHTSQSVGQVRNHLIDIFCPPRQDFSQRPGWVLNADEYPVPDEG